MPRLVKRCSVRGWAAKAALLGALGGTLPDLDLLFTDAASVDYFVAHRGISHSLFFAPLVALPLAFAGRRWRPAVGFAPWWCFWLLVLITHPLLDLFTSYGTQLLAPFSREPLCDSGDLHSSIRSTRSPSPWAWCSHCAGGGRPCRSPSC